MTCPKGPGDRLRGGPRRSAPAPHHLDSHDHDVRSWRQSRHPAARPRCPFLTQLYGPAVRCKPDVNKWRGWSCASVSGPCMERLCSWPSWISARTRSHSEKGPERPLVPPDHGGDGETVSPSPQIQLADLGRYSSNIPRLCRGSVLDIPSASPEHADVTPLLARRAHRSCVPAPTQSR